jgi:hypothetical protein
MAVPTRNVILIICFLLIFYNKAERGPGDIPYILWGDVVLTTWNKGDGLGFIYQLIWKLAIANNL